MTESTTDQRVKLSVDSPSTCVTVGLFYEAKAYSGVSVNTTEHVRFNAGGASSESDAIGQASGQVWLQSLRDLVAHADGKLMMSARVATLGVAKKGITVLAGLSSAPAASEPAPATEPASVAGYASKAAIAAGVWAGFDATVLAVTTALEIREGLMLHRFPWLGATSALTNAAGMSLNIVGLTGTTDVDLPGVHLFSEGGTFIGSNFGSVSIASFGGTLLGGLFTHQFGLWSATVRGMFRASLGASGPVDMSSLLWFESKSDGPQTFSARAGTMSIRGQTMTVGTIVATPPQLPTASVTLEALSEVSLESARALEITGTRFESQSGLSTEVAVVDEGKLAVGPWKVSVKNAGVTMGATGLQASIKIDGSGVTFLAPSASGNLAKMSNGKVELKSKAGSLTAASGVVTFDGTEIKIA